MELTGIAAMQLPFSEVQEFPWVDYERPEENFMDSAHTPLHPPAHQGCWLLAALDMPCFKEGSSGVQDGDLTGRRNSWGERLTCLSTKSGARKPGPPPGSSWACSEQPKEWDLWLWPAKLSNKSRIWRTTGCELVPMQLFCQARGIWKATEWITDPQPATHCLAQAVMCPGWHWSYPAARVLPATKAQHSLQVPSLVSGNSLDSDLIKSKALPPWALGAQQPPTWGLSSSASLH